MSIWSKVVKFFAGSPAQECKCKGQCDAMEAEARAQVEKKKKVDAILAESERIRRENARRVVASTPTPSQRSSSYSSTDDDDYVRRSSSSCFSSPSFDYSSWDSGSSCDSSSSCSDSGSSCGCD